MSVSFRIPCVAGKYTQLSAQVEYSVAQLYTQCCQLGRGSW